MSCLGGRGTSTGGNPDRTPPASSSERVRKNNVTISQHSVKSYLRQSKNKTKKQCLHPCTTWGLTKPICKQKFKIKERNPLHPHPPKNLEEQNAGKRTEHTKWRDFRVGVEQRQNEAEKERPFPLEEVLLPTHATTKHWHVHKIQHYLIISSEKLKHGWTLTTSQYTITRISKLKEQVLKIQKLHNKLVIYVIYTHIRTHTALTFVQTYLFRNAINRIWFRYAKSSSRWKKLVILARTWLLSFTITLAFRTTRRSHN